MLPARDKQTFSHKYLITSLLSKVKPKLQEKMELTPTTQPISGNALLNRRSKRGGPRKFRTTPNTLTINQKRVETSDEDEPSVKKGRIARRLQDSSDEESEVRPQDTTLGAAALNDSELQASQALFEEEDEVDGVPPTQPMLDDSDLLDSQLLREAEKLAMEGTQKVEQQVDRSKEETVFEHKELDSTEEMNEKVKKLLEISLLYKGPEPVFNFKELFIE